MQIAILIATAAFTLTGAAVAQRPQQPPTAGQIHLSREPNPHRAALRIGRELSLSPDQTTRLEPILAGRRQRAQAIRSNPSLSDADRRKQLRTVAASTRLQMADVLTPDQIRQLHAMRREHARKNMPAGA